jgi:hypothetical protein
MGRGDPNKLTPKEEKFVLLYVLTGSGAEAVRGAGYSQHTAEHQAREAVRVRSRPPVKAAIEKMVAERAARVGVKQDEILAEVRGLSLACESDRDRLTAYNMLGKALGMWTDRTIVDLGSQTLEQMVLAADRLYRQRMGLPVEELPAHAPSADPSVDADPDGEEPQDDQPLQ